MGVDDETLRELVRRILTVARPDRIILFGSAATGRMTPDSDVDILKSELDYEAVIPLTPLPRFRDVVAFHAQQEASPPACRWALTRQRRVQTCGD